MPLKPLLLGLALCLVAAAPARAENLVGVSSGPTPDLFTFSSTAPGTAPGVAITGLSGAESILGIDFRPATGQLYALTSAGRLYTINTASGFASPVTSAATVAPSGTNFGVDFDPVVDRLRVVSDNDQNLRVNPDTGAVVVDSALQYGPGSPDNPAVVGIGYTDNFPGAATTRLFGIDTARDALVLQDPPNAGTLRTVGPLSSPVGSRGGLDVAAGGTAFAVFATPGSPAPTLFTVNLATGALTSLGPVGTPVIADVAVVPNGTLAVRDAYVLEGGGNAVVRVERTGGSTGAVGATVATADGTATAGADYAATSATVAFAPGETVDTITVPITGDAAAEGAETVGLSLASPTGGASVSVPSATLTVVDDDVNAAPAVAFTSLAAGTELSPTRTVDIALSAADDAGVGSVELFAAGRRLCVDAEAPFTCPYRPSPDDVGRTTLTAVVRDTAGAIGLASRTVVVLRYRPTSLSSRTTPARDRVAPYEFRTAGRIGVPTGVSGVRLCAEGLVLVRYRSGRRVDTSRLVPVSRSCRYSATFRATEESGLRPSGAVTVGVRFLGSPYLLARSGGRKQVRAG